MPVTMGTVNHCKLSPFLFLSIYICLSHWYLGVCGGATFQSSRYLWPVTSGGGIEPADLMSQSRL